MGAGNAVTLLLYALGAFLVPLASEPLGVPAALGEILYGVVLGPHGVGLFQANPFATFLSELGFGFLMFLAGLEIDFSRVEGASRRHISLCLATSAAVFMLSWGASALLGLSGFLVLVFGAQSLGILLVTLNELRISRTHLGQTLLLVGSAGELLTLVLLTAMGFHHRYGMGRELVVEVGKLGLILVVAYAALVLLRTLIWWWPHRFSRAIADRDPSEVGVRSGMALMLAFIALASALGIEAILGAFLAGALFSFAFRQRGALEAKLASIGFGFFVPMFFIGIGTNFEIRSLLGLTTVALMLRLLAVSVAAKVLSCFVLLGTGMRARECVAGGLLLSAPLTLLVAIARIDLAALERSTASAVILLALVSGLLPPWVARLLLRAGAPRM